MLIERTVALDLDAAAVRDQSHTWLFYSDRLTAAQRAALRRYLLDKLAAEEGSPATVTVAAGKTEQALAEAKGRQAVPLGPVGVALFTFVAALVASLFVAAVVVLLTQPQRDGRGPVAASALRPPAELPLSEPEAPSVPEDPAAGEAPAAAAGEEPVSGPGGVAPVRVAVQVDVGQVPAPVQVPAPAHSAPSPSSVPPPVAPHGEEQSSAPVEKDTDLPGVDLPDVDLPGVGLPGSDVRVDLPDVELPEVELPEVDLPVVPELPDVDVPDVDLSDEESGSDHDHRDEAEGEDDHAHGDEGDHDHRGEVDDEEERSSSENADRGESSG